MQPSLIINILDAMHFGDEAKLVPQTSRKPAESFYLEVALERSCASSLLFPVLQHR